MGGRTTRRMQPEPLNYEIAMSVALCVVFCISCVAAWAPAPLLASRSSLSVGRAHAPRAVLVDPDSSFGRLNEQSSDIRCPFWRTRAYDALESALAVANFVAARHRSILDRPWLPGSERSLFEPLSLPVTSLGPKTTGMALEAVMDVVRRDYEEGQYYVTGRLSQNVYDDSCFFDSPDPDMPVRSLKRYSDALKGLFAPQLSSIELVKMEACADGTSFVAHWRLSGALKLPWRPAIKPYAGATLYELGDDGLIVSHTETWSISVLDAFVSTAWPEWPGAAAPAPHVEEHIFVAPPQRQQHHSGAAL